MGSLVNSLWGRYALGYGLGLFHKPIEVKLGTEGAIINPIPQREPKATVPKPHTPYLMPTAYFPLTPLLLAMLGTAAEYSLAIPPLARQTPGFRECR